MLLSLGLTGATAFASAVGLKYLTVRVGDLGLASISATVGLGAPSAAIATAPVIRHLPAARSKTIDLPRILRDVSIWGAASFAVLAVVASSALDTPELDRIVVVLSALILCIGLTITGLATSLASVLEDRRWVTTQLVLAFGQLGVLVAVLSVAPTGTGSMLATGLGTVPALCYSAWLISRIERLMSPHDPSVAGTRPPSVAVANFGLVLLAGAATFSVRYAVGFADLSTAAQLQVALAISGVVAAGISRYVQAAVLPTALDKDGTDVLARGLSIVLLAGLVCTGVFVVFGGEIITLLFDSDLAVAAPLVAWLIAAEAVYGLSSVFTTIAFALSRHRYWFVGSSVYSGARFTGLVLLVFITGMVTTEAIEAVYMGAAIASLFACVVLQARVDSATRTAAMVNG